MHRRSIGFTLIEILVVVLIISIVTGMAVLTVGGHRGRSERDYAEVIKQTMQQARVEAMLKPAIIGMRVEPDGIQWLQYVVEAQGKQGQWKRLSGDEWQPEPPPSGLALTVLYPKSARDETEEAPLMPDATIAQNGDFSDIAIGIGSPGDAPDWWVGVKNGEFVSESCEGAACNVPSSD